MSAKQATRADPVQQTAILSALPLVTYRVRLGSHFHGPRFLNAPLAEMTGYEAADFVDDETLWPSRIHREDLPGILEQVEMAEAGGTLAMSYRWHCADRSERQFVDLASLAAADGGAELRGLCVDITGCSGPRVGAATMERPASREALKDLTHALSNMVTVILWNLEPLSRTVKGPGKDYDRLQNSLLAATRSNDLVQQLAASL